MPRPPGNRTGAVASRAPQRLSAALEPRVVFQTQRAPRRSWTGCCQAVLLIAHNMSSRLVVLSALGVSAAGLACSPRAATAGSGAPLVATAAVTMPVGSSAVQAASPASGTASAPTLVVASAECTAFAGAYCDQLRACTPGLLRADHGDAATCSERWAAWCTRTRALSGSGFSDSNVRECEQALRATECRRWREFDDLAIPACHPRGAVALGQPCLDHAQCETGLCLHDPTDHASACGTCARYADPNGECFLGFSGPRRGCPVGWTCSRGYCIGPLKDEGEPCGLGSAWSSDCYGDAMLGRGHVLCGGTPVSPGVCERDPDFSPCGPDPMCASGAREGEACDLVDCSFPLLCVAGTCARDDPSCR